MRYKSGKKFWVNSSPLDKVYINNKRDTIKALQHYFDENLQPCKFCQKHMKVKNFTRFFLSNNSHLYDEEIIYTECGCGKGSMCIPFIELGGCYCYTTS